MSSSSYFSWSYLCISNCYLCLLSSVELTSVSRIVVFLFPLYLNLPLCLDMMSSSSSTVENTLYLEFTLSPSVFSWTWLLARTDALVLFLTLKLPLYLVLMSLSSVFSWTCLCVSNFRLHLLSAFDLNFCISNWCPHLLLSTLELTIVSRTDVFPFFL